MATSIKEEPEIIATYEHTMQKIMDGLGKMGSLPIFSASVNRIRYMSSSDETEVMELAKEITKDANLTIKLLRVTNSSQYNLGGTKISSISRAIVILGYDTVKSITMALKVIDSFQYENSAIDINALLAKSFMAAGFVKQLAVSSGVKDPEESYICALLHNLGEIIVATILPKEYEEMVSLAKKENMNWNKAQKKVLGTSLHEVAQAVFKKWEFPDTVIKTVANYSSKNDGPVKDKMQLNRALASISNNVIGSLYSPENANDVDFNGLMSELSEVSGLPAESISSSLVESFKVSCDLAEDYGLNKSVLTPKISNVEGGDAARDKIAKSLTFYVDGNKSSVTAIEESEDEVTESMEKLSDQNDDVDHNSFQNKSDASPRDPEAIIAALNEITNSIILKSDINAILAKILEGISHGVGFDRAILCFINPDRKQYKARLGSGVAVDKLIDYFSFNLDEKNDIFSQVMMQGEEMFVQDCENEKFSDLLPKKFLLTTNSKSFVVASLKFGEKPVGFFYADTGTSQKEITLHHFSGFIQFVSQAKLALMIR